MSSYDKLTGLINSGEVELIHIEAVPRSISTALCRALGESEVPSVCVNEPFNRTRYDMEDASTRILAAMDQATIPVDKPLTIVSKNMARNISMPIFIEMMGLAKGVVWSVREPGVQISSLITRIANNLEVEPGADELPQDDLSDEQIKRASDFLEDYERGRNFAKTNWTHIGEHYDEHDNETISVVIDGERLTSNPFQVLTNAAHRLGLPFSAQMVSGWRSRLINTNVGYNPSLPDHVDAWTKDAVTSTGIHPVQRQAIAMERMPNNLQAHINEVAIPTYERIMRSQT
jgi:hypothetical protein